jgi:hypothetical protein
MASISTTQPRLPGCVDTEKLPRHLGAANEATRQPHLTRPAPARRTDRNASSIPTVRGTAQANASIATSPIRGALVAKRSHPPMRFHTLYPGTSPSSAIQRPRSAAIFGGAAFAQAKGVTLKIVGCIVLLYLDLVWEQWHEASVVGVIMPQLRRGDQG